MAKVWDCTNWTVISHDLTPVAKSFSAGRGAGGFKQTTRMRNEFWRGTITTNPIRGRDMVNYRGFIAALNGQGGEFDFCICDPYALKGEGKTQEEWLKLLGLDIAGLCGPVGGRYSLPHADGTCFSDGTGYHIPDFEIASPTAGAFAGSTSIQMNGASSFLKCGNYFSTADHYLHIVTETNGSDVSFSPPLRRNLDAGEALETQNPKIRVRLSDDVSGTPVQNYGRWTGEINLQVEEVMTR